MIKYKIQKQNCISKERLKNAWIPVIQSPAVPKTKGDDAPASVPMCVRPEKSWAVYFKGAVISYVEKDRFNLCELGCLLV